MQPGVDLQLCQVSALRGSEHLCYVQRRHAEVQQKLKEENQGLSDDYRQVTTAFQDLTSKCQSFQHAHMDRVRQVCQGTMLQLDDSGLVSLLLKRPFASGAGERVQG